MKRNIIIKNLYKQSDKDYKNFESKLGINNVNLIGVRVPILKNYCSKLVREEKLNLFEILKDEYYEETLLKGLSLQYMDLDSYELFKYLDEFIIKIDNWAVCDLTISNLKIINKYKNEYLKYLSKYKNSNNEFISRFVIVSLLSYYINDLYIDEVLNILKTFEKYEKNYYTIMALGWAYSKIYINYKDKIINIIKQNKMTKLVKKITIKKINESYLVKEKDKFEINKYKN